MAPWSLIRGRWAAINLRHPVLDRVLRRPASVRRLPGSVLHQVVHFRVVQLPVVRHLQSALRRCPAHPVVSVVPRPLPAAALDLHQVVHFPAVQVVLRQAARTQAVQFQAVQFPVASVLQVVRHRAVRHPARTAHLPEVHRAFSQAVLQAPDSPCRVRNRSLRLPSTAAHPEPTAQSATCETQS